MCHMAKRAYELEDPVVVEIDDEFSRLPEADRAVATRRWMDSLKRREPVQLAVSGAEMVAAARAEAGW